MLGKRRRPAGRRRVSKGERALRQSHHASNDSCFTISQIAQSLGEPAEPAPNWQRKAKQTPPPQRVARTV